MPRRNNTPVARGFGSCECAYSYKKSLVVGLAFNSLILKDILIALAPFHSFDMLSSTSDAYAENKAKKTLPGTAETRETCCDYAL